MRHAHDGSDPSISIITAVLDAARTLPGCLDSVHCQGVPVEHIVVDGGSTDGTLEVVDRFAGRLARVVSEPDRGMYDALNKGLRLATGEVVGLLHADDVYAHRGVLRRVRAVFRDRRVESCYGDLVYVAADDDGRVLRRWRSGSYGHRRFYTGWMPPHPTFFVRRRIYERYGGFRLDLGSAADYELMLRFLLRHRVRAAYIPEVLVRMRTGGRSNASLARRLAAHANDWRAWRVNGLRPFPWTLPLKPLRKLPQFFLGKGRGGVTVESGRARGR